MITQKIKTTGGSLAISIPNQLSEITLGMVSALTTQHGDTLTPIEQLSVLSGIPVESEDKPCLYDICNIDDLEVFADTIKAMSYALASIDTTKVPKEVALNIPVKHSKRFCLSKKQSKTSIKINTDIGIQPYGAYAEAKEVINSEVKEWERVKKEYGRDIEFNPSVNSLIRILALYFYCPATGERFNPVKVSKFEEVVKQIPVTEGLAIARAFFLKYSTVLTRKATR